MPCCACAAAAAAAAASARWLCKRGRVAAAPVLSHERHLDVAQLLVFDVHDSKYESERESHRDGRDDDEVDLRVRVDERLRLILRAALQGAVVEHVDQTEEQCEADGCAQQSVDGHLCIAMQMDEPILLENETEKTRDADLKTEERTRGK